MAHAEPEDDIRRPIVGGAPTVIEGGESEDGRLDAGEWFRRGSTLQP